MTSNCIFVVGLGLELRIFNLTHQDRSEAKNDLGGHLNKPKGLKVAKEDQRLIGSMVNGLDGR